MKKFQLSHTVLTALDAYNSGASVDRLADARPQLILEQIEKNEPASLALAFEYVLVAAENLAKWAAALHETVYKIANMDQFDWNAVEKDGFGGYHRYQVMRLIAKNIDNNVS